MRIPAPEIASAVLSPGAKSLRNPAAPQAIPSATHRIELAQSDTRKSCDRQLDREHREHEDTDGDRDLLQHETVAPVDHRADDSRPEEPEEHGPLVSAGLSGPC